jgi:hypothetical protein
MKSRAAATMTAAAIGAVLTAATYWLAALAYDAGSETLSRVLSWSNSILQSLVPCNELKTAQGVECEGTPVNVLAYILSFPTGFAVYSYLAYLALRPHAQQVA